MGLLSELWDNTAGGLLWKPIKKATGLSDAQLALLAAGVATGGAALAAAPAAAGAGAAGAGVAGAATGAATAAPLATAPAAGAATAGAAAAPAGLMGQMSAYAQPAMQGLQAASLARGLLGSQPPAQPAQAQARPLQLDAGLLASNPQAIADEAQRRRQMQQQMTQNVFGGAYGRTA